jgi:pilus assembly protein FimV
MRKTDGGNKTGMGRKLAWLAVAACVTWLVPAWALSLGGIRIHSRLNQPLTASIPLNAGPGEVIDDTVKVRVAANEEYARAGLERLEFLSDLSFTVEGSRVVVSSRKIAREPVIDLLLEVRWNGGRLLRQYTILLDPEGIGVSPTPLEPAPAPPPAAAPAPAASGGSTRSAAGPGYTPGNVGGTRARGLREDAYPPSAPSYPTAPETSRPSSSPLASARPRTYGPVKANETPWSVASKLKPDESVTVEQVIIALFQWNPTAFGSSLTTFRPGAVLRVPDAEVVRRVDPQIAKARIAEAREKAAAAAPTAAPEEKPPALKPLPPPEKPAAEKPAPVETTPAPKTDTAPKVETAPPPVATAPSPSPVETAPGTEVPPATTTAEGVPPPAATAPSDTTETTPEAAAPAPAESSPRKKKGFDSWGLVIGIGIGALILIALIWRLMRRPKSLGEDFATPDFARAAPPAPRPAPAAAPSARAFEPTFAEPEEAAPPPAPPEPEFEEPAPQVTIPEPAPAPRPTPAPAPAAAAAKPAPFVDTSLTDTRQIDLEGGDALAEADFHLAYGLYDEAILLLTQALTRDPGRNDVRTKLAEAYFSANRGQEFMDTARALRDKLDPAGWEKIAVLGRQLFPNEALFGGSGKAQPAPSGETARAAPRAPEPPKPAPRAPDPAASIPFDLEPLDLNAPLEPTTTTVGVDAGVDLESRVSLEDSALGGDEATTKLDLARAYIDLGDNDMARGLLGEVIQQGSNEQKSSAEELMRKLPA